MRIPDAKIKRMSKVKYLRLYFVFGDSNAGDSIGINLNITSLTPYQYLKVRNFLVHCRILLCV